MLAAAEKHSAWIYAAIVTSVATGVRMGELLRLEWRDLDFDKLTLTVHISKTGKRRLVHLNAPAVAALKSLRRTGVVGPRWVFVTETGEQADKFYLSYRWRQAVGDGATGAEARCDGHGAARSREPCEPPPGAPAAPRTAGDLSAHTPRFASRASPWASCRAHANPSAGLSSCAIPPWAGRPSQRWQRIGGGAFQGHFAVRVQLVVQLTVRQAK